MASPLGIKPFNENDLSRIRIRTGELLQEEERARIGQAKESVRTARENGDTPETVRENQRLAESSRLPVRSGVDPLERDRLQAQEFNSQLDTLLGGRPRTTELLRTPDNAAIFTPHIREASNLEDLFIGIGNALARGTDRTVDNARFGVEDSALLKLQEANRRSQMTFQELREEARAEEAASDVTRALSATVTLPKDQRTTADPGVTEADIQADIKAAEASDDLPFVGTVSAEVTALWRFVTSRSLMSPEAIDEVNVAVRKDLEDNVFERAVEAVERDRDYGLNSTWRKGFKEKLDKIDGSDAGTALSAMADLALAEPGKFFQFMLETAVESAPQIAAAAGVAAVTRSPKLAAATMGLGSYSVSSGSHFEEKILSYGHDVTRAEGLRAIMEDPKFLSDLKDDAHRYGLVVALFDAVSFGAASKVMAKGPIADLVMQTAVQGVLGGAGEFFGRVAAGDPINWTEVYLEGLAELTTAPIDIAVLTDTGVRGRMDRAKASAERQALFQLLSGEIEASELKAADQEAFKDLIVALTKDGPVEKLHVDPSTLDELFQTDPDLDLEAFFDSIPELDFREYLAARDNGALFTIPTALYASKIAGTDIGAKLQDHIKLDPEDLSKAELKEFAAETVRAQKDIADNADKIDTVIGEIEGPLADELDRLTSEIVASGGFDRDTASRQAAVLVASARTGAQRTGLTVAEYLQTYVLPTVRNSDTLGPAAKVQTLNPTQIQAAIQNDQNTSTAAPEIDLIRTRLQDDGVDPDIATLGEVTAAAKALIEEGQLRAGNVEDLALPSTPDPAADGDEEVFLQTATLRAGEESPAEWGIDVKKRNRTRDIALALEARQRKKFGKINRKQRGPKTIEKMANWMATELEFELQTPERSAVGWYGPKFQEALNKLGALWSPLVDETAAAKSKVPGVKTVADARAVATGLFAVSSNGTKVVQNVENALNILLQLEDTGTLDNVKHQRAYALNEHLVTVVRLASEFGGANMQLQLTEVMKMSEINRQLRSEGKATKAGFPADMDVPYAAKFFGPKLAAFYANLTGGDGFLTMDLWWTRSINRYRGDVLPKVSGLKNAVDKKGNPIGLHRFKRLIGRPDLSDGMALNLLTTYAQAYKDKNFKNGTEAEVAANTLYKAAFVHLDESPAGAADRAFMIEVAKAAQAELERRTGARYSIADIQAMMWYYEKRLYAELNVRDSGDLSYEEAADALVAKANEAAAADVEPELFQGTVPPTVRSEVLTAGLVGDGRKFTGFFGDVTAGIRQQAQNLDGYVPPIDLPPAVDEFTVEKAKYSGNFDDHIQASIPGYKEMQDGVGYAFAKMLQGGGSFLRIGASEGSTVKAVVALAGEGVTGVAMDPNPQMKKTFDEKPQVDGVRFDMSAFGDVDDAGQLLWTEDTGEEIRVFDPQGERYDIVSEQMVFQFISNTRGAQVAAAKKLMKPDGLFYTAEKFGGPAEQYRANEVKKDEYKRQFFSEEELAAKNKEVGLTGGDEVEGMTDLQVSVDEMTEILKQQFRHVVQVWDSGNFKGYAASDNVETLQSFLENLPSLDSEFATVETPRDVRAAEPADEFFQSNPATIRVTAEDFAPDKLRAMTPEERLDLFKRPGWYVVTAALTENGNSDVLENVRRNDQLREQLQANGRQFIELEGVYKGTPDGVSFMVFGPETEGVALGGQLRQESVLTHEGLVFTDGSKNKPVPFSGVTYGFPARDKDFFSHFKGQPPVHAFSLNLDFPAPNDVSADEGDGTVHFGARLNDDKKLVLTHWSNERREVLSPEAAGSGPLRGPERQRGGPAKVFYGMHIGRAGGYKRESASLGDFRHEVEIDPREVYSWRQDPDGLRAKIDRSKPRSEQVTQYEELIKTAGYRGYFVLGGPLGDVAVLYDDAAPSLVLNENDAKIQRSETFREFFLDSKVTNPDGSPKMVYHGTTARFGSFFPWSHFGTSKAANMRLGTDDIALSFNNKPVASKGTNIMPAYLSLQNPLDVGEENFFDEAWKNTWETLVQVAETLEGRGDEATGSRIRELINDDTIILEVGQGDAGTPSDGFFNFRQLDHELSLSRENRLDTFKGREDAARAIWTEKMHEISEVLFSAGYDGIQYQNAIEDPGSTSYIAFKPSTVKSAFNTGSWDIHTDDILYQSAWHGTPHTFDAFDISFLGTGEGNQAFGWGLYFAEERSVAEWYRDTLTKRVAPGQDVDAAQIGGRLYKVTLPGKENLLNFDAGFAEQPEIVRAALERLGVTADSFEETASSVAAEVLSVLQEFRGRPGAVDGMDPDTFEGFNDLLEFLSQEDIGSQFNDANAAELNASVRDVILGADSLPAEDRQTFVERLDAATGRMVNFTPVQTGADAYLALAQKLGGEREASLALRDEGVPGHSFLDQGSRLGQGAATSNFVVYDDTQIAIDAFEQARNGSIVLPKNLSGTAVINLFETANMTTMLHETGHFFLWQLQRQARDGHQFAQDELELTRKWWMSNASAIAVEASLENQEVSQSQVEEYLTVGSTGSGSMDKAIHRALHEQFARGFEAYLMEGKAPSNAMRSLFESFAAWLLAWYRSLRKLNVNINDDIRGVFDRLLATEQEMIAAEDRENINNQIAETAREMGLDEDSYRRLVDLSIEAREEGRQLGRKEIVDAERRMRSQAYAARLAEIEAEERQKVIEQPVHRAIQWLAHGRWLGVSTAPESLPLELRFDTAIFIDEFDKATLDKLPRGRRPVHRKETGVTADEAAGWFGFDSGADLVEAMVKAPKLNDAVKANTEARALKELGDVKDNPDELAEISANALHGEKRGQVLVAELRALNRVSGGKAKKMTTRAQAKAIARDVIARMKVRDAIRPNQFLAAERRHAEAATRLLAAGNVEEAFEAKRKQLIQHELFIASRKAADMTAKAERLAGRLKRTGTRENLAPEYLSAIDDILETYDFRKVSGKAEERQDRLTQYIAAMHAAGRANEISIPQHVLNQAKRVPYKTIPVRQLEGVFSALKNIEHMARRAQKVHLARAEREMQEVRDEISTAFRESTTAKAFSRIETASEKQARGVRGYFNLVRNADTILRRIDNFKNGGPMARYFKQDIDDAGVRAQQMRVEASEQLDALFAPYAKRERRRMSVRKKVPGYHQAISKWDIISVALNLGNKDNLERITSRDARGSFTQAEIDALMATLDKRDWDFVQGVWDLLDNVYWPMIVERETRLTGTAPEKVEPTPVETPFGTLRGGYFPIVYDPRTGGKVADEQRMELLQNMMGGRFGKAQTKSGHLEARGKGGGGRTVKLGLDVFFGHLNNVIHDLAYSEAVANTWRLLQDPQIRGEFELAGLQADREALEWWVQDVAIGPGAGTHVLAGTMRRVKAGFTLSKLLFNMSTVAIQVTGVAQSVAMIGATNMTRGLNKYLFSRVGRYELAKQVMDRSPFMAERATTFQRDAFDLINETQLSPSQGFVTDAQRMTMKTGFWAMQMVQFYAVDMPTWLGAHDQGMREGMTDEQAVVHADRMVARAQASGLYADRTAVERGTLGANARQNEFLRLFTALGSYMFAKFNVANEVAGRTVRDVKDTEKSSIAAVVKGATDMVLLFTVEALLYNAIRGELPGQDDEDDEGWAEFIATETFLSVASTFPFIRDLGSALQGFGGGGSYGSIWETFGRAAGSAVDVATGEGTVSDFRSLNDAAGIALPGYPATAFWRVLDGIGATGEEPSPLAVIMGR